MRENAPMDERAIFEYARAYADRAEQSGRGTMFPTVRRVARRFRRRQQEVVDLLECVDASSIPGCDYIGLATGFGVAGAGMGIASYESIGEYVIEAYRQEVPDGGR